MTLLWTLVKLVIVAACMVFVCQSSCPWDKRLTKNDFATFIISNATRKNDFTFRSPPGTIPTIDIFTNKQITGPFWLASLVLRINYVGMVWMEGFRPGTPKKNRNPVQNFSMVGKAEASLTNKMKTSALYLVKIYVCEETFVKTEKFLTIVDITGCRTNPMQS